MGESAGKPENTENARSSKYRQSVRRVPIPSQALWRLIHAGWRGLDATGGGWWGWRRGCIKCIKPPSETAARRHPRPCPPVLFSVVAEVAALQPTPSGYPLISREEARQSARGSGHHVSSLVSHLSSFVSASLTPIHSWWEQFLSSVPSSVRVQTTHTGLSTKERSEIPAWRRISQMNPPLSPRTKPAH